jgi:hypothetical protein
MKNSIIDYYLIHLKMLHSKSSSFSEKTFIKELGTELAESRSVNEIHQLFCSYLENNPKAAPKEKTAFFNSSKLFPSLQQWKNDLENLIDLESRVSQRLEILPPSGTNDLLNFLKKLFEDRNSLLHLNTTSLLYSLISVELETTLYYLGTLPVSPWPEQVNKGDYLAIKPDNPAHAACLVLLNSNSQAYYSDHNNPSWDHANSILQTALMIFEDTRVVEIDEKRNFKLEEFLDDENLCCTLF